MAKRKLACIFGTNKCGLASSSVASLPPWNEAPAPIRFGMAAAVRMVIGPPMQ